MCFLLTCNWHIHILVSGIQHNDLTSVQFSGSVVSDSAAPWTAARQASLSITNSRSLLKLMSIEWVMPSKQLILCRPFSSCLNLSQHQGLFKWVSSSHEVAKVLEFQLQHQSFQWIFRTEFLSDGLVNISIYRGMVIPVSLVSIHHHA